MDERSNGNSRMILTVSVNFNHCGGSGNPDFSAPSPTSCCWNQLRLLPSPQRGVFLRARELEAGFVELRRRKQTLFPPHPPPCSCGTPNRHSGVPTVCTGFTADLGMCQGNVTLWPWQGHRSAFLILQPLLLGGKAAFFPESTFENIYIGYVLRLPVDMRTLPVELWKGPMKRSAWCSPLGAGGGGRRQAQSGRQ